MTKLESINTDRIVWCCNDRGITPRQLAEALKFPWNSIQKALTHRAGLTFTQLRKIAEYFNRSTLFFLEEGPVTPEQLHTPQFRTIANQKPDISPKVRAIIERVERQRDVYLSLREELGDEDSPRFQPPTFPTKSVKEAARITRQWLDLSQERDFATYRDAVETKGILVFRTHGYNGPWQIPKDDSICGFTVYDAKCPVIVVRRAAAEAGEVFTLMHELAHVLLHRKSYIDDVEDLYSYEGREREANAFAGLLLVPDEVLKTVDDRARPRDVAELDAWLRPLTRKLGVSAEVVLRRLLDSKRLNQAAYEGYRQWREKQPVSDDRTGSRKYRHREPRHLFGDPFVSVVLDALHAKQITLAKASTYLDNLKISDVHQLEGAHADHGCSALYARDYTGIRPKR